ncbi:Uncharacterised protein [uncultured archaeon]|nr:Uncharacterised protein [uncultured archaeon]
MQEVYQIITGIILLILGFPIGNLLARATKEELKNGQKYFRILIILSLIGAAAFLIFSNDALMFAFLFIAIVASRSLRNSKKKND